MWIKTLLILFACNQPFEATQLTSSASDGVACPNDTIVFTCFVNRDSLIWTVDPPPGNVGTMRISRTVGVANDLPPSGVEGFMFQSAVTNTSDDSLTSTLTTITAVSLLNASVVSCAGLTTESMTISVAETPSSPSAPRVSSIQNQTSSSIVTLEWGSPSTGGVSVSYVLTISPKPLFASTITIETTSAQITVFYNTPYNVSIRAVNCAGSSSDVVAMIRSIVTCFSNPPPVDGVTINSVSPPPVLVGSTLSFTCNRQTVLATCESDGRWSPDPTRYECASELTCGSPVAPSRGSVDVIGETSFSLGSEITYGCDEGLFPPDVRTSTCTDVAGRGEWVENPGSLVCRERPINCTLPAEPPNGTIVDYERLNETVLEGTVLTYQCNGLSLTGPNTITCTNAGVWSTEPEEIMCVLATGANIGAIVGGVIGGILALVCLIVIVVIALLFMRRQKSAELKEDVVEMSGLQGEYSELRHDGPRKESKKAQPPPPDSEGYSRINRNPDAGALTYDEVVINLDNKTGVNSEGYSVMNTGQAQRLPGYGQLGNVATVEPVVYAALSSSQPRKKINTTATVDQHQVTYATVDVNATRKQEAKAATLPASPTASGPADVDKLLDIDQALVQIRSMNHKWRELAETVRLPETLIEQIEDSCPNDNAGCLTEVIDQWMKGCSGRPTWRELADHLKKIGEEQLAKDLMSIYDTGRLPVELNMKAVPNTAYKYDRSPPPPVPSRSPTMTDDSPGQSKTLPPSRPPKATGEMTPARPPKPVPKNESSLPPRPPKHYAKH